MPKPVVRVKRNVAPGARRGTAPKAAPLKPPNLPQHELPEPYARLLTFDVQEADETFEGIAAELKAGDADAAAQKLIGLALDDSFYSYAEKYATMNDYMKYERRMMAPTNAVRVLTYMGEAGRAAIDPLLPLLNSEDDFLREELPIYYGAMGEAALAALTRTIYETDSERFLRSGASECLTAIAEENPETRDGIVSIIEQALANEKEDDELNGYLVCNLIDLDAKESYPIIAQAYEEDRVDPYIVGLGDVQEHFEMPITAREPEVEGMLREHGGGLDSALPPLLPLPASEDDAEPVEQPFVAGPKIGRNELCFCGSGKKYKKCHGV